MLFVVNVFSLEPCPFMRNFSDFGHDDEIDRSTHSSVGYGRATSPPSTSDEGIHKALGVNEGHPECPSLQGVSRLDRRREPITPLAPAPPPPYTTCLIHLGVHLRARCTCIDDGFHTSIQTIQFSRGVQQGRSMDPDSS